ncbi:MAG: hypothetical protein HETSPECPRED_004544 [Heterodermia speciosa]|uniref:TAFII55 protein conserved region domain-containing protein n=1 Tax=Heterodermia speciosa TaxID=116794 RepID=A0A8H3FBD6_9LECA|nr:MAG: hypothetical protein HETSPECPRED_004544 [Heterodermia speciosa]
MSEPRPSLKIKLNTGPPRPPIQPAETPTSAMPRLKLNVNKPKAPDVQLLPEPIPASPAPKPKAPRKPRAKKDKPARTSNPTPKKRALEESILSDDDHDPIAISSSPPPPKKPKVTIKIKTKGAPSAPVASTPLTSGIRQIKFKGIKGKKLSASRPKGVGYDSEAEDNESDPAIEEDFILRLDTVPDEHREYVRRAIAEQRFGPKSQGGADIRLRFLRQDGRRAVVSIQGTNYAASLVDLPCIIEGMKSWDKKAWHKSVDISQMLLVLGPIKSEEDAYTFPMPKRDIDEKTMQFAHGLTPPMRWVRKRRFRKRINRAAIEDVEQEVERLLAEDAKALSSTWHMVDEKLLERERERERARRQQEEAQGEVGDYDEDDAEGEDDDEQYFGDPGESQTAVEDEMPDDFVSELERALERDEAGPEPSATTPSQPNNTNAPSPGSFAADTPMGAESPAATASKAATSGDEEEESSDEDAESMEEVDEDAVEQQQDLMRQREAIEDLQAAIKSQEGELERVQNNILKKKIVAKIQSLRAELESKQAAVGDGSED